MVILFYGLCTNYDISYTLLFISLKYSHYLFILSSYFPSNFNNFLLIYGFLSSKLSNFYLLLSGFEDTSLGIDFGLYLTIKFILFNS